MAEYNKSEWIVVGISGVTCGGKTTLADRLLRLLRPVWVVHQDRYFYPDDSPHHVRCGNLEHNNYDILSALDMQAMRRDIIRILSGDGRTPAGAGTDAGADAGADAIVAAGRKFLVIEGFTVLNYKPIADLCDLKAAKKRKSLEPVDLNVLTQSKCSNECGLAKYYLTLELGMCAARRALRVYDPPDIPGYFELCVWPEHLKYKEEIRRDPTVRLLSGADPDVSDQVIADLRRLGATSAPTPARSDVEPR